MDACVAILRPGRPLREGLPPSALRAANTLMTHGARTTPAARVAFFSLHFAQQTPKP